MKKSPHLRTLLVLAFVFMVLPGQGCNTADTESTSYEELTLENGMKVLLLPHAGSGLIASNVFVGAGSTREEDRYAGSSHFLEHVLFNGTGRRTQEEIYAEADRIGAYNNATTSLEYTHYMMVAPAEKMAEALDIQSDMLLHSTLPTEKFEKERGIVLEELSKDKDDPDYQQQRALDELLYGEDDDFARPVLGTGETISALPRSSVVEYYRRQYVPSNMRMVLMGDFDPTAAMDLVQELFVADTTGAEAPSDPAMPGPACSLDSPGKMAMRAGEAPKVTTRLVVEVQEGSPDLDAALALLAQIAGGTQSSRVNRAFDHDPPVAKEEASAFLSYRQGVRLLELRARQPEGENSLDAARRLLATLQSLSSISKEELSAARTALLSQEISQLEQLHYYALFQGDRLWHMPAGFTGEYLAALEAADTGSLERTARMLLDSASRQIVSAGPEVETGEMELAELDPSKDVVEALQSGGSGSQFDVHRKRPSPLDADQPPEVLKLDNGLTLVHSASPGTRMFALHLLVKNRSLREPEEFAGMADLLHRSLAKRIQSGSDGGPPPLDRIGAELKAADNPWIPYDDYYTTPLYSFIRLECVDEYFQEALRLMADLLQGSFDDPKPIEDARTDMTSAIQRGSDRPSGKASRRFRELLYPGHALARQVLGNPESIARITPEVLKEFADSYLAPGQLVLAVVGNVPRDEALKAVESTLGKLAPSTVEFPTAEPPPLTTSSVSEEIEGGGNQSALRMGRIVDIDPGDRWALIVAARIASSRMQQDLRETRGLAYSLGLSAGFHGDRAVITASMGTRPENVPEAVDGLRSYFTGGELEVDADEIEIAVNRYLSRMRMRRVTSMGQAFTLSHNLFQYGDISYADRGARGLTGVTPEDVKRVSGRYMSDGPMVTVIAR